MQALPSWPDHAAQMHGEHHSSGVSGRVQVSSVVALAQVPANLVPARNAPVAGGDGPPAGLAARLHGGPRALRPAGIDADRYAGRCLCFFHAMPRHCPRSATTQSKPPLLAVLQLTAALLEDAGRVQTILLSRGIGVVCQGILASQPSLWPVTWVMVPTILFRVGALHLHPVIG